MPAQTKYLLTTAFTLSGTASSFGAIVSYDNLNLRASTVHFDFETGTMTNSGHLSLMAFSSVDSKNQVSNSWSLASQGLVGNASAVDMLELGDTISASTIFQGSSLGFLSLLSSGPINVWNPGIAGIELNLNGNTHYAWAEIAIYSDTTIELRSAAYNDVPDQGILAGTATAVPETSTLGLLILGAAGAARRRRRPAV